MKKGIWKKTDMTLSSKRPLAKTIFSSKRFSSFAIASQKCV